MSKIERIRKSLNSCPREWTPEQVADWIEALQFSPHDVVNMKTQILRHHITGENLLELSRSTGTFWMVELGLETQTHIEFMKRSLRQLNYKQHIFDVTKDTKHLINFV